MIDPAWNLMALGYEAAAQRIRSAISIEPGAQFRVYVDSAGGLYVFNRRTTRAEPRKYQAIIGDYTSRTPINEIEDDLLDEIRLRTDRRKQNGARN